MRSTTVLIHWSFSSCLSCFSFKQVIQCFFFIVYDMTWKTFNMNFTLSIILNWNVRTSRWVSWSIWKQVKHLFIINLKVTHFNCEIFIRVLSNFLKHLSNRPWNNTSILKVWSSSIHGKSLSCSCLSVAHNGTIVSIADRLHNFLRTKFKKIFLWSVMHYLIKLELPVLLNVINMAAMWIFWNMYRNMLNLK